MSVHILWNFFLQIKTKTIQVFSFPLPLLLFLVDHVTELPVVQLVVPGLVELAEGHLHLKEKTL